MRFFNYILGFNAGVKCSYLCKCESCLNRGKTDTGEVID